MIPLFGYFTYKLGIAVLILILDVFNWTGLLEGISSGVIFSKEL